MARTSISWSLNLNKLLYVYSYRMFKSSLCESSKTSIKIWEKTICFILFFASLTYFSKKIFSNAKPRLLRQNSSRNSMKTNVRISIGVFAIGDENWELYTYCAWELFKWNACDDDDFKWMSCVFISASI